MPSDKVPEGDHNRPLVLVLGVENNELLMWYVDNLFAIEEIRPCVFTDS